VHTFIKNDLVDL